MNTAEFCTNCEEPILGQPVFFDGGVYCCTGCIAGGPCVCTYQVPAPQTELAAPVAGVAPVYQAPTPAAYGAYATATPAYVPATHGASSLLADTPQPGREPIPFPTRDNGPRAIVLRLGGFRDQRDLLEFALALEDVGALAEVSLTRAEPADAWFAVRAASTQQVVAALQEVRGWLISANASESYVEGHVENVPVEVMPSEPDPVLPHRPRFRVFSPRRAEAQPGGLAVARSVPQPAVAEKQPAAYQQPEVPPVAYPAVALVEPVYTAPPAPVLPVPARPMSIPQPQRFVQPSQPVLPVAPLPIAAPAAVVVAPVAPLYVAEPAPVAPSAPAAIAPVAPLAASAPAVSTPPALEDAPAPRPAMTPPAEFRQSDMIAADDRPGGAVPLVEHLTLVVYPFHSFVALNDFQGAIRALRGVTNTRVRRFYRGTLHLAVDYEDIIPLAERLQDLRGFRWQLVSESRQEIELLLEDTGALMAAEGDG